MVGLDRFDSYASLVLFTVPDETSLLFHSRTERANLIETIPFRGIRSEE